MADGAVTEVASRSGFTASLVSEVGKISANALPERVLERTRHAVLDWLGCAISGAQQPSARICQDVLRAEDSRGVAQIFGTPYRMGARQAALAGGVASHSQDFDDLGMGVHPSVAVLPAVFAVAEEIDASGAAVVEAMLQGYEALKIALTGVSNSSYARGFHSTGTFGAFAAAVAVGRLLELDPLRQQYALGVAGMQASGLRASFGTMGKHLNAGNAAAAGVLSGKLAAAGFTGPPDVFEHPQGFAAALNASASDFDATRPGVAVGERLAVEELMFKLHAACAGTHSAMIGIRAIRARRRFAVDEVEEVELVVPDLVRGICMIPEPQTGMEGMLSLRYTAALALTDSDTGPAAFTDERVQDPYLAQVRQLVKVTPAERISELTMPTEVTIRLKSGETLEACVKVFEPRPDEDLPLQWADLEAKFHGLVSPILGADRSKELVELVRRFETLSSIRELTEKTALPA